MIQELKIRNFKSFRDEVELSFEPTEDDRYNSVVTMPDGVKLLRFAVVLGANASGKSNLLDAVEFLRRFWNTLPSTNDDGHPQNMACGSVCRCDGARRLRRKRRNSGGSQRD